MARTARQILTIVALLSVAPAGVGAQEENELDRFMAQVLEQQGQNVSRGLQYVLDERAEVRLAGPDRELLVQVRIPVNVNTRSGEREHGFRRT